MAQSQQGEEVTLTLDIPQREGKEGYIGTIFTLYLKMGSILQSPEFSKEPMRVYYLSLLTISMIPGIKNRQIVREKLKDMIKNRKLDFKKENPNMQLNDKELDHILIESAMEIIGDVVDFTDKHVGVSRENKIGFVVRK